MPFIPTELLQEPAKPEWQTTERKHYAGLLCWMFSRQTTTCISKGAKVPEGLNDIKISSITSEPGGWCFGHGSFLHCPQTIPPGCCMLYPRPQREVWTQPCKNPHFSLLQPIHPAHCTKATVPKESRFLNVLWVARPVSCLMNSSRNPCLSRHHPAFHFSAPAISYFMVMPGLHWRDCLLL